LVFSIPVFVCSFLAQMFGLAGSPRVAHNRSWLGDVAVFENRQPVTAAKFITKSSLFILLLGFIRRLEPKPNSEQKVENIFVAPPYCQTVLAEGI
jgi:hypothetical protein